MDLFLLKFMINAMTLIFPFLDDGVPRRASLVYTFDNLLGSLESAIMLRTSTREINI